ncbi:MAG: DUF2950 domain-containing protein [Hyphomicrobiales bacterium]
MTPLLKAFVFGICLTFVVTANLQTALGADAKVFASPEQAAAALVAAVKKEDRDGVLAVIGPDSEGWILSGDPVQDKEDVKRFITAYEKKNGIEKEGDEKAVLVVGDDKFPFPFPIVKTAKGWAFDAEQGKEELLNRRVGRNELNTIQVLLAVADAQFEYASVDRDDNGVLEYAAKLASSEGERDGLYWPTEDGEPLSPLGPLVAEAIEEGYGDDEDAEEEASEADDGAAGEASSETASAEENAGEDEEWSDDTEPYHGYRFRLLPRQGANAPGGAHEYMVGNQVIGGFAILAYPATYGNSGVMTFMLSHEGTVYDADLGPETAELAEAIESFDPGEGWEKFEVKQAAE